MFEKTVTKLISGVYICRVAHKEEFFYLDENESVRRQVDGYLTQIGKSLAVTPRGAAYYAAYKKIGRSEEKETEALYREIKHDIKPVLDFLMLTMQAKNSDIALDTGDVINFPEILHKISVNPHLSEQLQGVVSNGKEYESNDASSRALLEKLFQKMVRNGYLIYDRQKDQYTVTGEIDYYDEIKDYLIENEPSIKEAIDKELEGETGRLF